MPTDLTCTTCKGSGQLDERHIAAGGPLTPCPDCGGSGVAAWAVEAAKDVDLFDGVARYRERTIAEIAIDVLAAVREEAKNQ